MKKRDIKTVSFVIFLIAVVFMTLLAIPMFVSFKDPEIIKQFVEKFGVFGVLILLLLQIFQIVVALIPGEFVEFVAGTLYGWHFGLLICLLGIAIGQAIIFKAVRVWGYEFVEKVAGSEKLKKFKFLQNEKKLKTLTFILYFVPGTPKDVLAYVLPLTKIEFKDFMTISILARVLSVVSSTYAGDSFGDKNFVKLAVIYGIVAVLSIAGVIIYKKWEDRNGRKHKSNSQQ